MVLECVSKDYYELIMKKSIVGHGQSCFDEFNKNKVDYMIYMLFRSKKYKAGVIAGVKENVLEIPYSAPFSMIENGGKALSIEELERMIFLIDSYCKIKEIKKIQLRIQPFFHDESYLCKMRNCLLRNSYTIEPSAEDDIPNCGLCSFKESVGCEASCKYVYVKDISDYQVELE